MISWAVAAKHGRYGSRSPILTNQDLDLIFHTLSI